MRSLDTTFARAGAVERLRGYARLVPLHPAGFDTFDRVYMAEKREVLKTFTTAIRTTLHRTVPEQQTGPISYDHDWGHPDR